MLLDNSSEFIRSIFISRIDYLHSLMLFESIVCNRIAKMTFTELETQKLDTLVQEWLAVDINTESRNEITRLHEAKEYAKLNEKLGKRIAFGTAGLRSSMESGFAHMNDVTILQASQGLVQYLLDNSTSKEVSIVVGYDHRFNSQRFAEITASVAIAKNVKVYYLGSINNLSEESLKYSQSSYEQQRDGEPRGYVHTPLVPFAIDHFGASGGVMVTASHNPARDNGYKVYYGNGCQIIPPHDEGIAESIDKNLKPWLEEKVWDITGNFLRGIQSKLLVPVKDEVSGKYIEAISSKLIAGNDTNLGFDFVYTPMHGVGLEIFEKCANLFKGVKYEVVKEQANPDPKFTTVKFPNPEEKGALDLAIKTAESLNYKLVVASDPDADRFSVAIKTKKGQWRQLTGNEIGFLFAMYVIEELTPQERLSNTYLVNSTVSSQILNAMATKKGFHFIDTLTGFKWIGNKAIDLKTEGYNVPFGYEEAIGFMFDVVNDKDGISAAVVWLQLYNRWFTGSNTSFDPIDKLEEGYAKYGWFKECNGYYKLKDLNKTREIFETVRKAFIPSQYPEVIGQFKVESWRDLTVGYQSDTKDNIPNLPVDPKSQMITVLLKPINGTGNSQVRFTCRGSGTEPKLKVYIEGKSEVSEAEAIAIARECWNTLRDEWFKPLQNDLEEVV
ncbi:Phosphoglucomutase/phosphomannomutase [Scheffersomyces xylosifermentans]|uniref:Phosphoglucomutase/phosphomannomutase n=1 Tax=Scheffersomyces xylosifermentans TaxID=1304137 RepID=UPI00315D1E70